MFSLNDEDIVKVNFVFNYFVNYLLFINVIFPLKYICLNHFITICLLDSAQFFYHMEKKNVFVGLCEMILRKVNI